MLGNFVLVLPEITLTMIAILMQLLAVFFKSNSRNIIFGIAISLVILIITIINWAPKENIISFSNSFELSYYIYLAKALIIFLAVMSIIIYRDIAKITLKIEFITLLLLSTVGILISISARDFIVLFCGLELQALSSYAMAAFNNKNEKSSEAGLKYFILGSLISCLMLLGISMLYGFSGSVNFYYISDILNNEINIGLIVGAILVLTAILFKLSAAPFHIWTPDVYEGAPISAVTYFAAAQKMGILIVFINFITLVLENYFNSLIYLIKIAAILSIFIGSLGAIMQYSLKRLMAYSTILNIGYVLIAMSLDSNDGIYAAFLYMFIYVIAVIGFFACIIALFGEKSNNATFEDLKGIAAERKTIAAVITIIMFSMVGLPPLAGFFGKYYVFYNAIMEGEFILAILGIITSVVAAFYYLKIIKYMYFMESDQEITIIPTSSGLLVVSTISLGFTLFFFILVPSLLLR